MNRTALRTELRNVIADTTAPYGWSDQRLDYWLSEGQDKFCAQTGYWADKSSYTITTVLSQQEYAIPPQVISLRSLWIGNRQLIDAVGATFDDTSFADTTPQEPVYYRTDLSTGYITLFEPVLAGLVLTLRVHRRSKIAYTTAGAALEIPEEFHLGVVEYAAYKAFGDHDRELQDPVKAASHYASFKSYVRDGARSYRRISGDYTDVAPNPLYVV